MAIKKITSKGKEYNYQSFHVICTEIDSKRLNELSDHLEVNKSYIIRKALKALYEKELMR